MSESEYPTCPACGSPRKQWNAASSEMCEGYEFHCGGCLFLNNDGTVEVNWECRGTEPLAAAIAPTAKDDPVKRERERCAMIADKHAECVVDGEAGEIYIAHAIARAIRNPEAQP